MRRIVTSRIITGGLLATAVLAGTGAVAAAAPPDSSPIIEPAPTASEGGEATAELTPVEEPTGAAIGPTDPVIVIGTTGVPIGSIAVVESEPAWTGHGEGYEPAAQHEYLRVIVQIEGLQPRSSFEVDAADFIIQDADGFVVEGDEVPTVEQVAANENPQIYFSAGVGETSELPLTFRLVSGVAPTALFYRPSSDRLVTIAEFG